MEHLTGLTPPDPDEAERAALDELVEVCDRHIPDLVGSPWHDSLLRIRGACLRGLDRRRLEAC